MTEPLILELTRGPRRLALRPDLGGCIAGLWFDGLGSAPAVRDLGIRAGRVEAIDGTVIRVDPDSLCVHGDTPHAVQIAAEVRAALSAAGVAIEPFTAEV